MEERIAGWHDDTPEPERIGGVWSKEVADREAEELKAEFYVPLPSTNADQVSLSDKLSGKWRFVDGEWYPPEYFG